MKTLIPGLFLTLAFFLVACASSTLGNLKKTSANPTGCNAEEIQISETHYAHAMTYWLAVCQGQEYACKAPDQGPASCTLVD